MVTSQWVLLLRTLVLQCNCGPLGVTSDIRSALQSAYNIGDLILESGLFNLLWSTNGVVPGLYYYNYYLLTFGLINLFFCILCSYAIP